MPSKLTNQLKALRSPVASATGAVVLAATQLPVAHAQVTLEEVVVTARQRAESILDVPASVTAYSESEITAANIDRPSDFIMRTPGLSQVQTVEVGDMQVNVRGINSGRDTESSVALVVDGVLLTNPNALNQEMDNITQIEVLKGPQGAIYGRNALAGAIIISTQKPPEEFEANIEATAGNFGLVKGAVGIGGPLSDNAEGLLRIYHREDDGSFDNSFKGCDDCVNFLEETGVTGRIVYRPTDNIELDFKARWSEVKAGGVSFNASLALADAAAAGFGDLFYEDANDHEFYYINLNDPDNQQETLNLSLRGVIDLDSGGSVTFSASYNDAENYFMSAGTSNAFGIYNANEVCQEQYYAAIDTIPVPAPFFYTPDISGSFLPPYPPITCGGYQYQQRDQEDMALEIRYESSQDQDLRWMMGGYVADIDRRLVVAYGGDLGLGQDTFQLGFVPASGPNPTDLLYDDDLLSTVYAVFGSVDFDITEKLELGLALRYDIEEREVNNNVPKIGPQTPGFGAFGFPVCPNGPDGCSYYINPFYNANQDVASIPSREEDFSQLQPKVTLKWQASDAVMAFASYGVGFRSGGFNSSGTSATLQQFFGSLALADGTKNLNDLSDDFDKETSEAFEVGFKSRWLDGRLQLNGALYYTEMENAQDFSFFAGPFGSLRVVTNIDEAEIFGFEIDGKWLINENISVHGGYGSTDTEIIAYSTRPYTAGNDMPYIPEYTGNIGADLNFPLSTGWNISARWDSMFVGDTWFSPVQDDYVPNFFTAFGFGGGEFTKQRRDSFVRHDATVSLSKDNWSFQLWGRNITDEEYLEEVIPAPEFGGSFIHDTYGRTYGITVRWNYGG